MPHDAAPRILGRSGRHRAEGLLAGCGAPGPATPTSSASPTGDARAVTTSPPTPSAPPTCDTIITPSLVDTFAARGWTFRQQPFDAGSLTLDGGLRCLWGDFSVASDHVQIFGWAPATTAQQDEIRRQLLAQGWRLVQDGPTVYITESSTTAVVKDDEGFGMTYQFGDGWVRFADTKQGLLLIEWPRA